jgi:hypothetical protein
MCRPTNARANELAEIMPIRFEVHTLIDIDAARAHSERN